MSKSKADSTSNAYKLRAKWTEDDIEAAKRVFMNTKGLMKVEDLENDPYFQSLPEKFPRQHFRNFLNVNAKWLAFVKRQRKNFNQKT